MNAVATPLQPLTLAPGAGRYVLVAEDDAALRDALVDTLRFAGCRVTAVADGSAALAALEMANLLKRLDT